MKKTICVMLVALLLFACVPFTAAAAPLYGADSSGIYYELVSPTGGDLAAVDYDGNADVLTIPREPFYDGPVVRINAGAFHNCTKLKAVVIPDNITTITGDIFSGCTSLADVYCLASSKPDGWSDHWLGNCTAEVHWGEHPFSEAPFDEAASGKCGENLTWYYEPWAGPFFENVLTISGTGDMYDYTGYAVPWNTQLDAIDLVVIEEGVSSVGDYAFYEAYSLTGITLPSTLTGIGRFAFDRCYRLEDISLPASLKTVEEYAFYNCESITELYLPDAMTSVGEYAFAACENLTELSIPDTLWDIGSNAFHDTAITYSEYKNGRYIASRNNPYHMLVEMIDTTAEVLETHPDTKLIDSSITQQSEFLTTLTLNEGLLLINDGAFYHCTALRNVNFPSTLTTIREQAFCWCVSLRFLDFPASLQYVESEAFNTNGAYLDAIFETEAIPATWSENWAGGGRVIATFKQPDKQDESDTGAEPPSGSESNSEDNSEKHSEPSRSLHPIAIVLPILGVALIAAGLVCFLLIKKKKNKQKG